MDLSKFIQSELETINTAQITKWLEDKSLSKRDYKRLVEDFKAIVIMEQAGFYEQADARFMQWKNLPLPAEIYRYRLAIAGKIGGKRLIRKRFSTFPAAVQNHPQLKPWKKNLHSNPLWLGGIVVAGLLVVGITQVDFSKEATPEKVSEQTNVEQKLASLEKEVEQLKQKNEKLTTSEEKKTETKKPKADQSKEKETEEPQASTKDPEQALKEAVSSVQSKEYKTANQLLTGNVLTNKETAGMARFYKLIAAGKLKETKQSDYIAYRNDFPESGYMSDVLWMQAVYEQKNKVGNYKTTLQELAKQPDNEWSYAAKAILEGKSTLGD
ncbi:hypothetical protein BLD48_08935 [Exiguobacterium sp. KRL4]|uniref:hypothetical protein n=1 Tax=Exiguobacterium sp. KRL4 TaxID=1914536 RepID=UPI0008F972AF|nr:hypothetical protein [Exiguobacterium sp. KRL4]OIN66830.1 hypothetical protein BLD48_08935 [Exiguobacterium sp. KRL4]